MPKEALAKLNVGKGDVLLLTADPDGFRVTPYDEAFGKAIEAFERGRKKYRNALRELAD